MVHPFIEYCSVTKKHNYEDYGRNVEVLVINIKSLENMKCYLHDDCNNVNMVRPVRKFTH